MAESVTPLRKWQPEPSSRPWVLIIGGISSEGNARARRAACASLRKGYDVIWFDGFEAEDPENAGRRLPISEGDSVGRLHVASFKTEERNQVLNRMAFGTPRQPPQPTQSDSAEPPPTTLPRASRMRRTFQRINQTFRAYLIWRQLRPAIVNLSRHLDDPQSIVYCDVFSRPTAWHAVRLWKQTPVSMELPGT